MEKSKKMKIGIFSTLGALVLSLGIVLLPQQYEKSSAVSYDDSDYAITLSADELNNCTFANYSDYLLSLTDSQDILDYNDSLYKIVYNNDDFEIDEGGVDITNNPDYGYSYISDIDIGRYYYIHFNYDYQPFYHFNFIYYDSDNDLTINIPFEYSLTLYFDDISFYNATKEAIEKDISSPIEPPKTLWNYIRDWFVQYIWGGTDSEGNIYSDNLLGKYAYTKVDEDNNVYESDWYDYYTSSAYIETGIPTVDFFKGGETHHYIALGDYLSTTSTIIVLVLLVIAVILGLIWLFKLIGGLLLLR